MIKQRFLYFSISKLFIPLVLCFVVSACIDNAPRDNVLDPKSGKYLGQGVNKIRGMVHASAQRTVALPGAMIILSPGNLFAISATDGSFEFSGLQSGNYSLLCTLDGYRPDSVSVNLPATQQQINFGLNALPGFETIVVTSHHISRWWPLEDAHHLTIETRVFDADGVDEIDSVWMEIPAIAFSETLFTTGVLGLYQQTVQEAELPVQSMHALEGRALQFLCRDKAGNVSQSEDIFIVRIIDQVPVLIAPVGLAPIDSFPAVFSWKQVFVDYDFHYKIEIYRINLGFYSLVRTYDNIPFSDTAFEVTEPLPPGDYFWSIYIVDEFGDTSSSKEGAFNVP